MTANSYTGGMFGMTIPNDYRYADYERDRKASVNLILAIASGNVEEVARVLDEEPESEKALGRATAYVERNCPREEEI